MSVLKQRKQSMETKFARDGELEFHARIRAFRSLAAWARSENGGTSADEEAFVKALIREDMRQPGDEAALAVARDHLGGLVEDARLRAKLEEFTRDARSAAMLAKAS
ncbi:hypothetical protein CLV78_10734 [Aliiruegeria haliotis]|uniref:DUF1476 domain-containing protein n=1 Tax=Aliiruegeria haliotis TaxID=1280846 RepID=A0A2T0RLW1_9RHOB|nr:ATPase inhibitor subunit zeta [Aliiruegeria haliotis]PRY22110.1 hypothetical protein CLV78_10734 [Aliiruegeria haliotis]